MSFRIDRFYNISSKNYKKTDKYDRWFMENKLSLIFYREKIKNKITTLKKNLVSFQSKKLMKSFEFSPWTGFSAIIFFCANSVLLLLHIGLVSDLHGELKYAWSLEVTIKENSKSGFPVEKKPYCFGNTLRFVHRLQAKCT